MIDSCIIVSSDMESTKKDLLLKIGSNRVVTFFVDEFKVDDAKAVIKEAYIAEEEHKYLILAAKSYNVYAQNSLLKLLEEPPKNIVFILIISSKNSLLPTIRSRLKVEYESYKKEEIDLKLDISTFGLQDIFIFLKEHKYSSKDEVKSIVEELLVESIKEGIELTSVELEMFSRSIELLSLNSKAQSILSYLLLMIFNAKSRGKK